MSINQQIGQNGFVDRYRELIFLLGLLAGALLFTLGFAFFILGVALDTTPPSPYLKSFMDQVLLLIGSILAMISGIVLVRMASKVGGW